MSRESLWARLRGRRAPLWIDQQFASLADWRAYLSANPGIARRDQIERVAQRILQRGFIEPFTDRRVAPHEIAKPTGNWREELLAHDLNSRMRASLLVVAEHLRGQDAQAIKIFATEAITAFALHLRGVYPKFLGSEYARDAATAEALFPVPHQDLTALTLPTGSFDLVTTNEVLEHVPDLDAGLREIARVLKPGGWHIGTLPFAFMSETGDVRARLVDGEIVHLKEPEIHGNPVDPTGGSLVFETPGWDIVPRARAAGFSNVVMRFIASERHGVISSWTGIFVLCAQT